MRPVSTQITCLLSLENHPAFPPAPGLSPPARGPRSPLRSHSTLQQPRPEAWGAGSPSSAGFRLRADLHERTWGDRPFSHLRLIFRSLKNYIKCFQVLRDRHDINKWCMMENDKYTGKNSSSWMTFRLEGRQAGQPFPTDYILSHFIHACFHLESTDQRLCSEGEACKQPWASYGSFPQLTSFYRTLRSNGAHSFL